VSRSQSLPRAVDRLIDQLTGRLYVDWLIAALAVGLDLLVVHVWHHGDFLGWSKPADRVAFYSAADTVVGIIVGFTIAALAFFYTIDPGRRLRYVQEVGGDTLRKVWIGSLTAPLMAVGVFTVAILIDNPDVHSAGVRWVVEFFGFMVVLRFTRLIWLFGELLHASTDDNREPKQAGRPVPVRPRNVVHAPVAQSVREAER
jgi:hypothetical protein